MTQTGAGVGTAAQETAQLHATLRFATAVTSAFVLGEFAQWTPTFLAAVLVSAVLGNLPVRPPPKMGLGLVLVMALAAGYAYFVAVFLRGAPWVMFGVIVLSMLIAFHGMLTGKSRLSGLLALLCLTTIPVVTMVAPAHAGILPRGLVFGIVLAMLMIYAVYAIWPTPPPVRALPPTPGPGGASPLAVALLSTAAMLPVVLVYLLFGLTDVMPVIIGTLLHVATFDVGATYHQAGVRVLANLMGGLLGMLIHTLLVTTPSLTFLALLMFVVLLGFGQRIFSDGPSAQPAVVACNGMLIILGSSISAGTGSLSLWLTRVFLFALAGAVAVGLMSLLWHWFAPRPTSPAPAHAD